MKIMDLFAKLGLDARGLKDDAAKAGKQAGKAAGTEAGKGVSGGFKGAFKGKELGKGIVQGLGLGAALGGVNALTTATAALTDAVFHSIDAASDQREAMSLTGQVFEENTGQIEEWAEGAADAFGQSKTEALNFASAFGTAFKNVGFSIDETADKSKELTHLAADLGSAFNASSDEAATALRSGLLGESEPLRRFGVFLSEAAVDAELMRKGQKKVNGEWTNGQKVLARYQIIMDQTVDSQGMFGRDTESLADAQKSLNADLENVSAEAGEALLPAMTALAKVAKEDLVPALREVILLAKDAGPVFEALGFAWSAVQTAGMGPTRGTIADQIRDAEKQAREARVALDKYGASMDAERSAAGKAVVPNQRVAGAIDDVGDEAKDTKKSILELRDALLKAADDLIANYYDPIQIRQEILANKQEISDARRVLSAKNSSREEINAAKATITAAQRANDELALKLLATGKMSDKEHKALVKDLQRRLKTATGDARTYLNGVIRKVNELDGMTATIRILQKITTSGITFTGIPTPPIKHGQHGAHGEAFEPVITGETGRELVVPRAPWEVIPHRQTESILSASSPSAGNTTINVPVHGYPMTTRSARDITTEMIRLQSARVLPSSQIPVRIPRPPGR